MRKTVLVVDDEEPFLLSLVDGLAAWSSSFRLVTAMSAESALAIVGRFPVDLVVTDLKMPGMDGLEMLRRLRQDHPNLPVIIMTAFRSAKVEAELQAVQPVAVLDKPLDLENLIDTVICTLARKNSDRTPAGLALCAALVLGLSAAVTWSFGSHWTGHDGESGSRKVCESAALDWRFASCRDRRA